MKRITLLALLFLIPAAARAQYTLYGLGDMGGLASRAAGINDMGMVAGTVTGT